MGCGSSSSVQEEQFAPKITPANEKKDIKDKFTNNLLTLKKLCEDLGFREGFQELTGQDHEKFEEMISPFWDNYKKKLEDEKLTRDTFKDLAQAIAAQYFIEQHLQLMEWELHEIIKDFTLYIKPTCSDFAEIDLTTLSNLLKDNGEIFPNKQKGLIYFIESLRQQNFALGHININLRLNPDYDLKVLNIGIFGENIENLQFLKGLAEVIEYNSNLVTVAIQIIENYDDKLIDKKSFRNLNIILEAVRIHKNIKVLVITLVRGAELIDIGPEVLNKVIDIVKTDRLLGLYLIKISLNIDFGKKLGDSLENIKNLKFLGLGSSDANNLYLTEIFQGISKNNSLNVVFLNKYSLSEDMINALRLLASTNKSMKLFKYFKEDGI